MTSPTFLGHAHWKITQLVHPRTTALLARSSRSRGGASAPACPLFLALVQQIPLLPVPLTPLGFPTQKPQSQQRQGFSESLLSLDPEVVLWSLPRLKHHKTKATEVSSNGSFLQPLATTG